MCKAIKNNDVDVPRQLCKQGCGYNTANGGGICTKCLDILAGKPVRKPNNKVTRSPARTVYGRAATPMTFAHAQRRKAAWE